MAPPLIVKVAEDAEELAELAAETIVGRAPAAMALAGGSTPRRTYELLSNERLDHEVDVYLTDERCVPMQDPLSNSKMISEALVSPSFRLHLPEMDDDCPAVASRYSKVLGEAFPLDLAVLGLGEDGHTASLFPDDARIDTHEELVAFVPRPQGPHRITMTLKCLSRCRHALFLVSGSSKADAVTKLISGSDVPAAKVRPEGSLTLLVTKDAISTG